MTKKAERQEVQFAFDDGSSLGAVRGKTRCGICTGRFTMPEVAITLGEFLICPSCVLSGPAAVAAEAKRTVGDKDRSAMWGCEDPADTRSIAKEVLALASELRHIKSFYEIRGGMVALAIAGVAAGNGSKRFHEDNVLIISQDGQVKMWRGHREKRTHRKAA